MSDTGKELARMAIDGFIAVMVPVLMVAAVAAEGYYLFWPARNLCAERGGFFVPGCSTLTMLIGMTILVVATVAVIHAGGTWLQKFLHRHLHFLDWA